MLVLQLFTVSVFVLFDLQLVKFMRGVIATLNVV